MQIRQRYTDPTIQKRCGLPLDWTAAQANQSIPSRVQRNYLTRRYRSDRLGEANHDLPSAAAADDATDGGCRVAPFPYDRARCQRLEVPGSRRNLDGSAFPKRTRDGHEVALETVATRTPISFSSHSSAEADPIEGIEINVQFIRIQRRMMSAIANVDVIAASAVTAIIPPPSPSTNEVPRCDAGYLRPLTQRVMHRLPVVRPHDFARVDVDEVSGALHRRSAARRPGQVLRHEVAEVALPDEAYAHAIALGRRGDVGISCHVPHRGELSPIEVDGIVANLDIIFLLVVLAMMYGIRAAALLRQMPQRKHDIPECIRFDAG